MEMESGPEEQLALTVFIYTVFKDTPVLERGKKIFQTGFYPVLSNVYLFQLENRNNWKRMFESRFKLCGFEKIDQIVKFLQSILIINVPVNTVIGSGIKSLALINELVLFLHHKKRKLFLSELAHFWSYYFKTLKKLIGNDISLPSIYSFYAGENLENYVNFVERFFQIPYRSEETSTTDNACCLNFTMSYHASKLCETELNSKEHFKTSEIASTMQSENNGLGIRPHEELLLQFYGIQTNTKKSQKNFNMLITDGTSFLSPKENSNWTSAHNQEVKTLESRDLPSSPAVSRLEQKRRKIKAAYAKRTQQRFEETNLTPM